MLARRADRQLPAPVRYFRREEGGVSHFHYLRDNALLAWMHLRLLLGLLLRLPSARGAAAQIIAPLIEMSWPEM